MKGFLAFAFLLFSLNLLADVDSKFNYFSGCFIFDSNLLLNSGYPGTYCVFQPDGSFVSAYLSGGISYYDKHGEVKWSLPLFPHHQVKIDSEGNIVVLTSDLHKVNGENVRFDSVVKISSLDGKILSEWSLFKNQRAVAQLFERGRTLPKVKFSWLNEVFPNVKYEVSHFNSIYEIPQNSIEFRRKEFQAGNYILNCPTLERVFILDHDLKKVLWSRKYSTFFHAQQMHDVQVLENGNILAYVNLPNINIQSPQKLSLLREFNPLNGNIDWEFGSNKKDLFYSGYAGSVQSLGNEKFIFVDMNGAEDKSSFHGATLKMIDRKRNSIFAKPLKADGIDLVPQDLKQQDLSSFLKNNRPPI